ncbi:MAG: metallophosphoesterase [Chlamydiia bacterium]|nr:metallophosphoesterase [Chlamydiia bacterium]
MAIWVIGDLHLAVAVPDKDMAVFGPAWEGYMERMAAAWKGCVGEKDLVLLPGDISWAMRPEEARVDLEWIERLPGTKVMIRGNHDYWWSSLSKVKKVLPPSLHVVQNDAFQWEDGAIAGARLWDTDEYRFDALIERRENPRERRSEEAEDKSELIFQRELNRLELSLQALDPKAKWKIAMTHYPPIGLDLAPSRASQLLEKYGVDTCVFGHLHNVPPGKAPFGTARGVTYHLTSADYLEFRPQLIKES